MNLLKCGSLESDEDKIARYFSTMLYLNILESNRGTIDQLKHSGSLRYFKNKQLTSAIISYYNLLDQVNHRIQYLFEYGTSSVLPFYREHSDSRYNDTVFRLERKLKPFRKMGEEQQVVLFNISGPILALNRDLTAFILPEALQKGEGIIRMIKKEYHLE